MTKTNETKTCNERQKETEIAHTKMTIGGLTELLEIRFLRGDEEGCLEITAALEIVRKQLADLEN